MVVKVKIDIDRDRCKGCMLCVVNCPRGVIQMAETLNVRGVPFAEIIDNAQCTACTFCALVCPECCICIHKENVKPSGT